MLYIHSQDQWVSAITHLLMDATKRQAMAEAAFAQMQARLSVDPIARTVDRILSDYLT